LSAYDRDFVYLHAYDQVLYHSPAYSRDLAMKEKLVYCGARSPNLWPLGLFDAGYDPSADEETLFKRKRDIDVIFVGALHVGKMPLLAKVKKALGKRFVIRGLASVKKNLYFNARHGFPGWVRPLPFHDYVRFYQRAKIGINVHNRGKFTVGGYRLFELPANGVMQISDGGEYLGTFFEPGREIVGYETADQLIEQIEYYLERDDEREAIARAGYRRVVRDHRMAFRLRDGARLIAREIAGERKHFPAT
jgi:spore maturation protein CgeB